MIDRSKLTPEDYENLMTHAHLARQQAFNDGVANLLPPEEYAAQHIEKFLKEKKPEDLEILPAQIAVQKVSALVAQRRKENPPER